MFSRHDMCQVFLGPLCCSRDLSVRGSEATGTGYYARQECSVIMFF